MTTQPTASGFQPGDVSVSIDHAVSQADPSRWRLDYSVHNIGETPVWLVVDERLVYKCNGNTIELSCARAALQPGVHVFGYFDPKVIPLPAGNSWERSLRITWPCQLSDLWNPVREAAPIPGNYDVSIRIGYALTALPEPPRTGENVETPVLRWQQTAVSPPVKMSVAPYVTCSGLLTP